MTVRAPAPASPTNSTPRRAGSVAKAAGTMMFFVLVSRLLGLLRDMVIAHEFGISVSTDAYNAAFKIPDLLMYLLAGGALSSTFIPVFSEYLHRENDKAAWRTFSIVATTTLVVSLVLVCAMEIFAPQLVHLMNPGFESVRLELATRLTRIVLPAQIFFLLGGLLMGTLNARGQFLIPAIGPSIYNLGIIFGAVVLAPFMHHDISALMWGALGGAIVGNFALQYVYVVRLGMNFKPSLNVWHPGARKVWKMLWPIIFGVSLPNVDQIINSYFGSELSLGSQTAMQYANRLMLIPIGIFAQAIGVAILPSLSSMAAAKNMPPLRRTIVKGLRTILFLTVPASVLMYVLAEPIVVLLFQHGHFSALDSVRTAAPLRFYAVGIFAWSAQAILTRAFYSMQDSRTPVMSGSIMTVVFIAMNWFVVNDTTWGVAGLAAATSIAATLHMVVLLVCLDLRLRKIAGIPLLASATKTMIASAAMCVVSVGARTLIGLMATIFGDHLTAGLQAIITGAIGATIFVYVANGLHMPELDTARGIIDSIFGKVFRIFRGGDRKANGMA